MRTRNAKLTDFEELKDSVISYCRCVKEKPEPFEVSDCRDEMLQTFF